MTLAGLKLRRPPALHVTFVSGEVQRAFLSVLDSRGFKRGGLEVTVVNTDGSFEGRIIDIYGRIKL